MEKKRIQFIDHLGISTMENKKIQFIDYLGKPFVHNSHGQLIRSPHYWRDTCPLSKDSSITDYQYRELWIQKVKQNYPIQTRSIYHIPIEIMIDIILPMTYPSGKEDKGYILEVTRFSQVCTNWWKYFGRNEIWKKIWIDTKIILFYENKLKKLINSHDKYVRSKYWDKKDIDINKCPLMITNNSSIPFDIYWIDTEKRAHRVQTTIQPHSKWICNITFPNHKWCCIPTKDWLIRHKVSSIGFSWIIDVYNLYSKSGAGHRGGDKLYFIQNIYEPDPEKFHIIKQMNNKNYDNYRRKVMRLVIPVDKFKKNIELYNRQISMDTHELRSLLQEAERYKIKIKTNKSRTKMYKGFIDRSNN